MVIKQDKIKHHNASLAWSMPVKCNLDCSYCVSKDEIRNAPEKFIIDISSLIKTLDESHKIFEIVFTGGGEPFLVPNLIEACETITKKHYISLLTNLTSPKVAEFANKIDPKKVLFIRASVHIKELEKRNLLDVYFNNFFLLKDRGFNIHASEVAHPLLLAEVKKYKKLFNQKGVELKFEPFRGEHDGKLYPQAYIKKEIEVFNINPQIHYQHKKFCNAGYSVGMIFPNGDIKICGRFSKKIGNIYKTIDFKKNLLICPFKFCDCPLNSDHYLLNIALSETKNINRRLVSYIKYYLFILNRFATWLRFFFKSNFLKPFQIFDSNVGRVGIVIKKYFPNLYFQLKKIIK